MFEVQDASSQLIGKFLGVEEGMRVVDVCAGAGGKTLHLAALMKNKGQIIALDIFEWKLAELKEELKEPEPIILKQGLSMIIKSSKDCIILQTDY